MLEKLLQESMSERAAVRHRGPVGGFFEERSSRWLQQTE